ncbi:hypothetical protein H2203_008020 [Taxawa tesnikishii (nom. ined.)]|nr:hypothetical protein H2203_008020 [Dothideales sp. JES 119]
MDNGHHNCRDYYLDVPSAAQNVLAERALRKTRPSLPSRASSQPSPLNSPVRRPDPFPFLRLPLELRRQVYSELLPRTEVQVESGRPAFFNTITAQRIPPTHHNLSPEVLQALHAQQKAASSSSTTRAGSRNTIWRRGQTSLLSVSRQVHDECAELLYGEAIFVIFVTYDNITFRFRWLNSLNGLTPSRTYEFLDLVPPRYMRLIKRLDVTVDHVDSYTGMIKFNVGGKGLTHGLEMQVARLVKALEPPGNSPNCDVESGKGKRTEQRSGQRHEGLKRISVKLLNGNDHLDAEKRTKVKARESNIRGATEVQTVLDPLAKLKGLVSVELTGAVTEEFAAMLRGKMTEAR